MKSQTLKSRVKYLLIMAAFLIVIGLFLPRFGGQPVPLETFLLVFSKYTVGIFHLIAVVALAWPYLSISTEGRTGLL